MRFPRTCFLLLCLSVAPAVGASLPGFEEVKADYHPSDASLLDRHGEVIHRLRVDPHGRRLDWTHLNEISPALVATLVRAEDKRFYQHAGVDWKALMSAAVDSFIHGRRRGASTITMQLAAQLDPGLRPTRIKRSYAQKWNQIEAARELEKHWSKAQILEAYFNLVTYRGELQGIAAAAQGLFGKAPGGLDEAESLLLSSLLREPNASTERVAQRACRLAAAAGVGTSCATITAKAEGMLENAYVIPPDVALAPHVARQLMKKGEFRTSSTLDATLQTFARQALHGQLRELADRHVAEGAVLVVDNRNGDVLAYLAGGPDSRAVFVDGVQAMRQAGSTLKPFLYGLAFEQRLLTAASLIDDAPVDLPTPNGLYVPQNYDRDFKGLVSARLALSGSLNVPAVKTLMLVGSDAFVDRLRALGFDGLSEDGDFYGYSLALGSAEVTLWQLVNGYRALANGGRYGPLRLQAENSALPLAGERGEGLPHKPGNKQQVMSSGAAFIVDDILADRGARVLTFGLESPLATRYWSAVKTGTSKDMRDNWCVGFSGRYTVGVWVGNYDGSPMQDVSGISGAAPVWLEVMNFLHASDPGRSPIPPAGVEAVEISFDPPVEPPRREWFLAGTATKLISLAPPGSITPRIRYPGEGEVIALDPDIPPERQAVFFEMSPNRENMRWYLDDGQEMLPESRWKPQKGKHVLRLVDGEGKEVDRVRFEVR